MSYLDDDFLLHSPTARRLFHEVACDLPILDYHTHLSPQEIATNHRWDNLADLWLGGDHYKWRLMRAAGHDESLITGPASGRERFQAWAATMPLALRNPLYDWTHLELRRYFGIEDLLSAKTADKIWHAANERLQEPDFCVQNILAKFRIEMIGTTDDPADSLEHHQAIAASGLPTKVLPTFRPDNAFQVDKAERWNAWIAKFEATTDRSITRLDDLLDALKARHDDFHAAGARLSDHSFDRAPSLDCTAAEAAAIFDNARAGRSASPEEREKFCSYVMHFLGRLDAARGWTKQLHLGPVRNPNTRMFEKLGADSGYDTIGDTAQGTALLRYLDSLAREDALPNVIIYNINPRDNMLFAALSGCFQDSSARGKIQFGAGWWFNDTKEGIRAHFDALASTGTLGTFVGMLTDSRSFLSFPRHEYFRRILCQMLGSEADRGELPNDFELLAQTVRGICCDNVRSYIGLDGEKSTDAVKKTPFSTCAAK